MNQVRLARETDAEALLGVYRPYIDTPITFECEVPSAEAFAGRIREITAGYPYLVWERDGEILGYAYAHRQKERAAYQWNAELSIYLRQQATSQGVGKCLYGALIDLVRLQNVKTVYGCVTVPNAASERLHRSLGFALSGVFRSTGYKCGRWRDVAWFEKQIAAYDRQPADIIPFCRADASEVTEILTRCTRSIEQL